MILDPNQIQLVKVLDEERLQKAIERRRYGRSTSIFGTWLAQLRSALKSQPSQPARVAPATPRKAHS